MGQGESGIVLSLAWLGPGKVLLFRTVVNFVRNMVFFKLFLYYFSPLFYDVLSLSTLFSQFHSSRKDNTRAIDHMT